MGRWRWYWSQGRKSAEGRRQRGSLGLALRKAWQPSCAMHVRWVPWRGVPVVGLWNGDLMKAHARQLHRRHDLSNSEIPHKNSQ